MVFKRHKLSTFTEQYSTHMKSNFHFHLPTFVLLTVILFSCNSVQEKTAEESTAETKNTQSVNTDSLVQVINQKKTEIENGLGEAMSVSTAELREKIKQKWEKIHFYTKDNQVVRIKTYPYTKISARTEEFYLDNGRLILAVIEDKGDAPKGEALDQLDKVYYFHEDAPIFKKHKESEGEYSVRNSDGEELLTEVKEYLEIFRKQTQK